MLLGYGLPRYTEEVHLGGNWTTIVTSLWSTSIESSRRCIEK